MMQRWSIQGRGHNGLMVVGAEIMSMWLRLWTKITRVTATTADGNAYSQQTLYLLVRQSVSRCGNMSLKNEWSRVTLYPVDGGHVVWSTVARILWNSIKLLWAVIRCVRDWHGRRRPTHVRIPRGIDPAALSFNTRHNVKKDTRIGSNGWGWKSATDEISSGPFASFPEPHFSHFHHTCGPEAVAPCDNGSNPWLQVIEHAVPLIRTVN